MKKITIIALLLILFYSNSVLAASSPIENGAFPTADIDQDGSIDALTDGLLTLRYLFGFRGQTLIANTSSPSCTRCSADQITTYLATAVENKVFDCDGNNIVDALTDGLLFARYLFGFSGNPLIENVVGSGAQHTTSEALQECLNTLTIFSGDTNDGATYNILPLGDSITDSYAGRPSYRRTLWKLLVDADYTVDFVGNESTTNIDSSFQDFDLNHEGHPGWEAGEIDSQINEWLTNITPDIVLLHIGTNDLDRGQSNQSTLNEIDSLIQKLRIKNPNMAIFMAKIIPMRNFDTASFNTLLNQFVAEKTTNSSPIFIVDQYTGFDANTDNYDNYHPNEIGENKIATKWFEALQNYFNE